MAMATLASWKTQLMFGNEAGTHKRTYRIRSILHSEFVLHIIVSTAYNSTVFQVQMHRFYKK